MPLAACDTGLTFTALTVIFLVWCGGLWSIEVYCKKVAPPLPKNIDAVTKAAVQIKDLVRKQLKHSDDAAEANKSAMTIAQTLGMIVSAFVSQDEVSDSAGDLMDDLAEGIANSGAGEFMDNFTEKLDDILDEADNGIDALFD